MLREKSDLAERRTALSKNMVQPLVFARPTREVPIVELRRQKEEAKARVDELARRYRIIDLASLPKDQASAVMETFAELEPMESPVSEETSEPFFGWAAEPYQTIMEESPSATEVEESALAVSDERRKYKEYYEARQVYNRTAAALSEAERLTRRHEGTKVGEEEDVPSEEE